MQKKKWLNSTDDNDSKEEKDFCKDDDDFWLILLIVTIATTATRITTKVVLVILLMIAESDSYTNGRWKLWICSIVVCAYVFLMMEHKLLWRNAGLGIVLTSAILSEATKFPPGKKENNFDFTIVFQPVGEKRFHARKWSMTFHFSKDFALGYFLAWWIVCQLPYKLHSSYCCAASRHSVWCCWWGACCPEEWSHEGEREEKGCWRLARTNARRAICLPCKPGA